MSTHVAARQAINHLSKRASRIATTTAVPTDDSSTNSSIAVPSVRLVALNTPAPSRSIRVGLSTRGGSIALVSASSLVITDGAQAGRRLVAQPGEIVTFSLGAPTTIAARGQNWSGPISVRTSGGTFGAWRVANVYVAGGPTRVSSNGQNPRYARAYRGSFEIAPQGFSFEPATHRSPLRVVNVLPLDEYLKGVVPWEMDASAPLEALKAQAICARSEALAKLGAGRHAPDGYEICDFDHCQGYVGTENASARSDLAVDQTSGLAMFYNGKIADAVYYTKSGGVTAASGDIWNGSPEPYLQSVREFSPSRHPVMANIFRDQMSEADWISYCTQNLPSFAQPTAREVAALQARRRRDAGTAARFQDGDLPEYYRWRRGVRPDALALALAARPNVLKSAGGPMKIATEMRVLERAPSGHIVRLLVAGRDATNRAVSVTLIKDSQIRALMSGRLGSTTALPSSTFVILPRRDRAQRLTVWDLRGAGWGHGAGMCQRGAQNHALAGWDARRIIAWYYRGIELRRVP